MESKTTCIDAAFADQRGAALPIVLFVTMSIGALSMAHLTMVMSENKSVRTEAYAARAQAAADADLEIAKNIINAAPYEADGTNTALAAAVAADPPFVPGTSVLVESLGGDWYVTHAIGSYQGVTRRSQAFVRTRTPLTSYNYFVSEQKLGISGAPRGRIHSNDKIEFYFPWGRYQDEISAVNGFDFKAGATAANTHLLGQWNDHAEQRELLSSTTIPDLAAMADTMRVDDNLIAEVTFQGANTEVKLFTPQTTIQVPRDTTKKVFDHYEMADVTQQLAVYRDEIVLTEVPVYEMQPVTVSVTVNDYENQQVTSTVMVPVYEWQDITTTVQVPVYATRNVDRNETRTRWVEDPPPVDDGSGTGTDLSGSGAVPGHWENYTVTVSTTETYVDHYNPVTTTKSTKVQVGSEEQQVTKTVKVKIGSHSELVTQNQKVQVGTTTQSSTRHVFDHYDNVVVQMQVPIYIDVPITVYDTVIVPEELVETRVVPSAGIIYLEGPVRAVSGQLDGRLTLVTNSTARITGSIQYIDADGRTRMQNGLDPSQPYQSNPEYQGHSALAVLATNDVRYSVDAPQDMEINASLISLDGMVGFDGLTVADDGSTVSFTVASGHTASDYQKESIRRLGGIISRKRPVSTHLGAFNQLIAGFARGNSMMDRKLMIESGGAAITAGGLEQNQPTWTLQSAGKDLSIQR